MSNATLTVLEQQAAEMQAKLDEMKATIEQQRKEQESIAKPKENLFGFGVPEVGQEYSYFRAARHSLFEIGSVQRQIRGSDLYKFAFTNKEKAQLMAEAFQVLIELRMCEGVVAGQMGTPQYTITTKKNGTVYVWNYADCSATASPFFSTKESAELAINIVGWERIRKAFLTLQGTFE